MVSSSEVVDINIIPLVVVEKVRKCAQLLLSCRTLVLVCVCVFCSARHVQGERQHACPRDIRNASSASTCVLMASSAQVMCHHRRFTRVVLVGHVEVYHDDGIMMVREIAPDTMSCGHMHGSDAPRRDPAWAQYRDICGFQEHPLDRTFCFVNYM